MRAMGKGGFRLGAGRPAWHVKVERCRALDIRNWAKEGLLQDGRAGVRQWTNAETGQVARIGYSIRENSGELTVVLNYRWNDQPVIEPLPIERTDLQLRRFSPLVQMSAMPTKSGEAIS